MVFIDTESMPIRIQASTSDCKSLMIVRCFLKNSSASGWIRKHHKPDFDQ
ncbi:hypothetical protein SynBIOSE41_01497 [Synechococcus sp. BIOS-E4-1]|nr:hypothetical protein SynBIOSE41_01497 [Synechococcus sp. BIOS-E4-1]